MSSSTTTVKTRGGSPKQQNGNSISVRDVQQAMPAESVEESRLFQAVEKEVATGELTTELPALTIGTTTTSSDTSSTPPTVQDDLFHLTVSLNNMFVEDQEETPATVYRDKEETPKNQTDQFAANAGNLFHRLHKKKRNSSKTTKAKNNSNNKVRRGMRKAKHDILEHLHDFKDFVSQDRRTAVFYGRNLLFWIVLPCLGIATLLYYALDNPIASNSQASYSWWLLFVIRQAVVLVLARLTQFLLVDYLCQQTRLAGRILGPYLTLFLVQARGWPFILTFWGFYDLLFLSGDNRFAHHWLFYQSWVDMMNEDNPSGNVTSNQDYQDALWFAVFGGIAVAIKRFYIGFRFSQRSYHRYAENLATVLKSTYLVSKVARFALPLEDETEDNLFDSPEVVESVAQWMGVETTNAAESPTSVDQDTDSLAPTTTSSSQNDDVEAPSPTKSSSRRRDEPWGVSFLVGTQKNKLSESETIKINEMLGEWEEVDLNDNKVEAPSVASLVQFRASVSFLDTDYPFSPSFGKAKSRERMVFHAQRLYNNLLRKQYEHGMRGDILLFQTVALTALDANTMKLNVDRVRDLIAIFRPTRDGELTMLDFCKSVDTVYKEVRLLRAGLVNESRMNSATEQIINVFFYFAFIMVFLAVIGIDAWALFGAATAFIVGFAFMIGGASSKYFEGLLLVLVQRPYDIGDRINVAGRESESNGNGAAGWIVKDVTLYHTTVIFGMTQEYATISNGSLAQSRIMNMNRSPRATLNYRMKFGVSVPSERINLFKEKVTAFVKERPREWLNFAAFRMTKIEADLGYVEYITILQHREGWQQIGSLMTSLAEVQTYAFDLSKEMDLGYEAPPLPVDLRYLGRSLGQQEQQQQQQQYGTPEGGGGPGAELLGSLNSMFRASRV